MHALLLPPRAGAMRLNADGISVVSESNWNGFCLQQLADAFAGEPHQVVRLAPCPKRFAALKMCPVRQRDTELS
jgi:hypothetical protein